MTALRCHCGHSALDCACVLRDPPGEPSPEETATLARIHGRLTRGLIDADEWTLMPDDPRRCKRCQRTRCECFVTDAAQARDAAVAEERRASKALRNAPVTGAAHDARIAALTAVEAYQAELCAVMPDHDRTDVRPLAALRALHGKGQGE